MELARSTRPSGSARPSGALILALALLALSASPVVLAEEKAEEAEWDVSNPPGDWQTITIDTTKTTWSSVSVAPDGRSFVFDMLGDLWSVPIEGGEATPLTQGIEWDFQPRYGPDGNTLVFVSDRGGADNLWLMDADGSNPRAVTEEREHIVHNSSWSPDGSRLVAKKGFTGTRSIPAGEIWLFHPGGGGGLSLVERPLGEIDQKNIAEPMFSPDGRYLCFTQDATPGAVWQYNKDSTGRIHQIQRYELETEVFVSGPGGAVGPTPSPDGKTLAFVKRMPGLESALYLKDLESGNERVVYRGFERDHQETNGSQGNALSFSWS